MRRQSWAVRLLLFLWALQLLWLGRHFAPEARDLAWRLANSSTGAAVHQEDPFYRWLQSLAGVIPPHATYIFLDDYQAGKEIVARYHLLPRRHVLLPPDTPPGFLFYSLRREKASYLIIRQGDRSWRSKEAVEKSPAFRPVPVPGPGLVFRADYARLLGGFHD